MDSKIQRLIRLYVSYHFIPVVSNNVVGWNGLEPSTSRLSAECSNQLSYQPILGGDERDRTDDPLLAKQVLSQLSYTPTFFQGSFLNLKN